MDHSHQYALPFTSLHINPGSSTVYGFGFRFQPLAQSMVVCVALGVTYATDNPGPHHVTAKLSWAWLSCPEVGVDGGVSWAKMMAL